MIADRKTGKPLIITIDTEGDNLWAMPSKATTDNARYLPRFQELCEKYALKPVYLVNHEMATSSVFQEFARDCINRDKAEIGMHLHAWNSPPHYALTSDDAKFQPYLFEYPEEIMRQKIEHLTKTLEDAFGCPIVSHRAGRWGFNTVYARILADNNYLVDCSVTPWYSWEDRPGSPEGSGGPDFSIFPEEPYFMDLADISRPGNSELLEVPVSIVPKYHSAHQAAGRMPGGPFRSFFLTRLQRRAAWLRPGKTSTDEMISLIANSAGKEHFELMLHSSELMPGGSPTFTLEKDIDDLYEGLERLFFETTEHVRGMTLKEFYRCFQSGKDSHQ